MTSKFSKVFLAVVLTVAALLAGCSKAPGEADLNLATARQKADSCVEPESVIRSKHMALLMHQRDATMLEGIRTRQHSLKECINCHVSPTKADGTPLHYGDKEHFCTTCHAAVGEKIDCFQCHADRPDVMQARDNPHQVGSVQGHPFAQATVTLPSASDMQMVAQSAMPDQQPVQQGAAQ